MLLVKLEALDWPLAKLFALLFEPELFAVPAPFMEFPLAVQLTTETVLELAVTPEEFETEPLEPTRFEFATVVIVLLLLLPPPAALLLQLLLPLLPLPAPLALPFPLPLLFPDRQAAEPLFALLAEVPTPPTLPPLVPLELVEEGVCAEASVWITAKLAQQKSSSKKAEASSLQYKMCVYV